MVGYANRLIAADPTPGNESVIKLTTGGGIDSRELDSPVTNMALHGGRVVIATRSALWLLGDGPIPLLGNGSANQSPSFPMARGRKLTTSSFSLRSAGNSIRGSMVR